MKIVKFKTKGYRFEFVCDHRNTRNGFAHDAKMFMNDRFATEATCHYLNRTWEYWGYQSVCLECVWNLIKEQEAHLKDKFKAENGISRITAKWKTALEKYINADEYIKVLKAAKKVLNDKLF